MCIYKYVNTSHRYLHFLATTLLQTSGLSKFCQNHFSGWSQPTKTSAQLICCLIETPWEVATIDWTTFAARKIQQTLDLLLLFCNSYVLKSGETDMSYFRCKTAPAKVLRMAKGSSTDFHIQRETYLHKIQKCHTNKHTQEKSTRNWWKQMPTFKTNFMQQQISPYKLHLRGCRSRPVV